MVLVQLGKGSKTPVTANVHDGGPKSEQKKDNGKGGYPPPPITESGRPKSKGKKITEKGGTPPPITDIFRNWGF